MQCVSLCLLCFVLFCSLPFSLFLGWSSGICCVIRLKDDLGTIHSNQQTFLKPRFLKPKIIWEMNWSIPHPQNGTFNPPICIWWWFNCWIEEVVGSISLISTQFQFWAGQGPMLNASADQISWCRIHKHTKCVTNWAKNKKTGARLIYKHTDCVTQFKQRLEARLFDTQTHRPCVWNWLLDKKQGKETGGKTASE